MSIKAKLLGNKYSPAGTRVPTSLLPEALRWERARQRIFIALGNHEQASKCSDLLSIYERRVMEETNDL